jgi:hypothetical protein
MSVTESRVIIPNKKQISTMHRTATELTGNFIDMRSKLEALDASIKADEKSKAEFEIHLTLLNKQRYVLVFYVTIPHTD